MNTMKTLRYILFILATGLISGACYDDKDPVAEIITPTGKGYYPVSGNTFVDLVNAGTIGANRIYAPGINIAFELQYWSEAPIKEINLYKTVGTTAREKVYSKPYSEVKAFSRRKSADTLIFHYTTPVVATTTNVKLEVEIVNDNTLSLTRSLTLQSKP